MVEAFFKSITLIECKHSTVVQCKAELIWRNRWDTRRQAEGAIFQYINGFYNSRRRHSSLGGKSPLSWFALQTTAGQCLAFERKAA